MDNRPTKSGYLMKRGEYNTAWKVRWCKVDNSKLIYYKKPENAKALGFVPLEQAFIRRCREDLGEKHCFEIVTKLRVYYMVAKSEAELIEWMNVLSLRTTLHKENELLEQAEALIAEEARKQALEDEKKYLARYKQRPKTTTTWNLKRVGSVSDLKGTRVSKMIGAPRLESTPTLIMD